MTEDFSITRLLNPMIKGRRRLYRHILFKLEQVDQLLDQTIQCSVLLRIKKVLF